VARLLGQAFANELMPRLRLQDAGGWALPLQLKDRELLESVARVSANGEGELAKAVLDCFAICGSNGNVTLTEAVGPRDYIVTRVDGYPLQTGYEELGPFYVKFINDPETSTCLL
jgi:hypothetical protein